LGRLCRKATRGSPSSSPAPCRSVVPCAVPRLLSGQQERVGMHVGACRGGPAGPSGRPPGPVEARPSLRASLGPGGRSASATRRVARRPVLPPLFSRAVRASELLTSSRPHDIVVNRGVPSSSPRDAARELLRSIGRGRGAVAASEADVAATLRSLVTGRDPSYPLAARLYLAHRANLAETAGGSGGPGDPAVAGRSSPAALPSYGTLHAGALALAHLGRSEEVRRP